MNEPTMMQMTMTMLGRDVERKRLELRSRCETVQRRMVETLAQLDALGHVNSLGVLQGLGSEVDRLCGEYSVLRSTYDKLTSAIAFDAANKKDKVDADPMAEAG